MQYFNPGQQLFEYGSKADCFYILLKGKVALTFPKADNETVLSFKAHFGLQMADDQTKKLIKRAKSQKKQVFTEHGVPVSYFITEEATNE